MSITVLGWAFWKKNRIMTMPSAPVLTLQCRFPQLLGLMSAGILMVAKVTVIASMLMSVMVVQPGPIWMPVVVHSSECTCGPC